MLAVAVMAQAKTYTLADLAELVPVLEDGTGVAVVDGAYIVNLPTSLPEGVEGIGYDDNNILVRERHHRGNCPSTGQPLIGVLSKREAAAVGHTDRLHIQLCGSDLRQRHRRGLPDGQ